MPNTPISLESLEAIQLLIVASCLLAALHTLRDAWVNGRLVFRMVGATPLALAWHHSSIRQKFSTLTMQVLLFAMKVDRLHLLTVGYHPQFHIRWSLFGFAATAVAVLSAAVAWMNMLAYRRLRDSNAVDAANPPR